jgi:hypothetical protein
LPNIFSSVATDFPAAKWPIAAALKGVRSIEAVLGWRAKFFAYCRPTWLEVREAREFFPVTKSLPCAEEVLSMRLMTIR